MSDQVAYFMLCWLIEEQRGICPRLFSPNPFLLLMYHGLTSVFPLAARIDNYVQSLHSDCQKLLETITTLEQEHMRSRLTVEGVALAMQGVGDRVAATDSSL